VALLSLLCLALGMMGRGYSPTPARAFPTAIEVTTTSNAGPGSLRQAILDANANIGNPDGSAIIFNIPVAGTKVINPQSALPAITRKTTIDGYTQGDAAPNTLAVGNNAVLRVAINGSLNAGITCTGHTGLTVSSPVNVVIKGLIITSFGCRGISLDSGALHTVEGNLIGTNNSGTAALSPNMLGIYVGVDAATIGGATPATRNLISGNDRGIEVGSFAAVTIAGNYIGTTKNGTAKIDPSQSFGVKLDGSLDAVVNRNVISGNSTGVEVTAGGTATINQGFLGTDPLGEIDLGNGTAVRVVDAGTTNVNNNVISGNTVGVSLSGTTTNALILANRIGTNAAGTAELGNGNTIGVSISGSDNNTVYANLISGNTSGISLTGTSSGNRVYSNSIGTSLNGLNPIPNTNGVSIAQSANDNDIGTFTGNTPNPNLIAFNQRGVSVTQSATNNRIRGNSIHSNAILGIDLGGDGPTANDPLDADVGPNGLQNKPTITQTAFGIGFTLLTKPNTQVTIDFYLSPACIVGEGRTYLASIDGMTNGAGSLSVGSVIFSSYPQAAGLYVSLTASTDDGTSEFSDCKGVGTGCPGAGDPIPLVVGATGATFCGNAFPLPLNPPQLPANVSAVFRWENPAQLFLFWFRGFPAGFNTLAQVLPMSFNFFQSTGGTQIVNGAQVLGLLGPGEVSLVSPNPGAHAAHWSGLDHGLAEFNGYLSPSITAIFQWRNSAQQFLFWFRSFPDGFQTLTSISRGSYYFFQNTGGLNFVME